MVRIHSCEFCVAVMVSCLAARKNAVKPSSGVKVHGSRECARIAPACVWLASVKAGESAVWSGDSVHPDPRIEPLAISSRFADQEIEKFRRACTQSSWNSADCKIDQIAESPERSKLLRSKEGGQRCGCHVRNGGLNDRNCLLGSWRGWSRGYDDS